MQNTYASFATQQRQVFPLIVNLHSAGLGVSLTFVRLVLLGLFEKHLVSLLSCRAAGHVVLAASCRLDAVPWVNLTGAAGWLFGQECTFKQI